MTCQVIAVTLRPFGSAIDDVLLLDVMLRLCSARQGPHDKRVVFKFSVSYLDICAFGLVLPSEPLPRKTSVSGIRLLLILYVLLSLHIRSNSCRLLKNTLVFLRRIAYSRPSFVA